MGSDLRAAGLCVLFQLPHRQDDDGGRADGVLRLLRRDGRIAGQHFPGLHRGSIAQAFFSAAVMFLAMALWGYTTQRDLTKMGSFLIMGLIGIIVASLREKK